MQMRYTQDVIEKLEAASESRSEIIDTMGASVRHGPKGFSCRSDTLVLSSAPDNASTTVFVDGCDTPEGAIDEARMLFEQLVESGWRRAVAEDDVEEEA